MKAYENWLRKRLSEVHDSSSPEQVRELGEMRLILFSDLHKGQRDAADDFEQCEPVYLAALDHYWQGGFELFLLGDIEELWECRPRRVVAEYENVLEKEKAFAAVQDPRRYWRLVGNHDDQWYEPAEVEKHLGDYLNGSQVLEGMRLQIQDQGQELGELFLVHGHQGTLDSDRYRWFSKWVVRLIWRPIQRLFRIKSTTPSTDFELKQEHELAMYGWAVSQSGCVLIAGHTHHPVWEGLSYEQALMQQMGTRDLRAEAEAPWIARQIGGPIQLPGATPCYFNTGCCSFDDGSITGLELEAGEIRLVRWENGADPERRVLFSSKLADVFAGLAGT